MNNSVRRAISILWYISSQDQYPTLASISRELNIPKSTAFSIIHTLVNCGVLEIHDEKRMAVGLSSCVFEWGQTYLNRHGMPQLLRAELSAMSEDIRRSAALVKFTAKESILMELIPYSGSVYPNVSIGEVRELGFSGSDLVYLASLPEEEIARQTIFSPEEIKTALPAIEKLRETGYYIAKFNQDDDLYALCLPVMISIGFCFGMVCVYDTEFHPDTEDFKALFSRVQETALSLSHKVAFMN